MIINIKKGDLIRSFHNIGIVIDTEIIISVLQRFSTKYYNKDTVRYMKFINIVEIPLLSEDEQNEIKMLYKNFNIYKEDNE